MNGLGNWEKLPSRVALSGLAVALALALSSGVSWAQNAATSESSENMNPIPIGTVINSSNWQKYRQYLVPFVRHCFAGTASSEHLRCPPDAEIVVGPYKSVPPPAKYLQDTEKYAGRTSLKELPDGGLAPVGYVAGIPFPNPAPPHQGAKIIYDMYYNYKPWVQYRGGADTIGIDRYGNITRGTNFQVNFRMRHVSDVGMPMTLPNAIPGIFISQYLQQETPEQGKYTSVLVMFPEDPAKQEQLFVYIPALRRSLRSSSASRCAPAAGSDNFWDDFNGGFNGIPTQFHYTVLNANAQKLWLMPMAIPVAPMSDFHAMHLYFPKPVVGKWDVRPSFKVQISPIASVLPGYCYPKKISWFDKQTFQIIGDERYDVAGRFWKAELTGYYPMPVPGQPGSFTYNSYTLGLINVADFQNDHYGGSYFHDVHLLGDVPQKYQNIQRFGSPAGLDEIMQ